MFRFEREETEFVPVPLNMGWMVAGAFAARLRRQDECGM